LEVLQSVTSPTADKASADDKEQAEGPRFPGDRFFTEWFRNKGNIYFFLFKKNHKVTNIQTAELIALLRSYRIDSSENISFLSVEGYKQELVHIAESFEHRATRSHKTYYKVDEQYGFLIRNLAAIDVLFGSCIVYLPPGLKIDLKAICSRSGYIHSCGRNVYIRNIYKSNKMEMFRHIKIYLKRFHPGKCLLFRPFSHEDFTGYDRNQKDDLKSGLDDVKLSIYKYFVGEERLADVIESMRSYFRKELVLPMPGDYHRNVFTINDDKKRKKSNFESHNCLFLVMDHSTQVSEQSNGTQIRGDRHFIICYDQECVNENPFHLFDENKPAWFDHTTLPHTLAGAMINISRPFWPQKNGPVAVCDCFVGSGTTILEAGKFDGVVCCGLDFEPISQLLVEDNLEFFSLTSDELRRYDQELEVLMNNPDSVRRTPADKRAWQETLEGRSLKEAKDLLGLWEQRRALAPQSSNWLVMLMRRKNLLVRLIFYTLLKGVRRYEAAISARAFDLDDAFREELVILHHQFEQLIGLRKRTEKPYYSAQRGAFQGSYSESISISVLKLKRLLKTLPKQVSIGDCRKWSPRSRFDLIITDPPYGFNTNEDRAALAMVYTSFLRTAIRSLRDNGQLVLALPDWSHTGRRLPAFILKDFVVHQVLAIAEEVGREVILSADQIPKTVGPPPYYWESEKALRRAILHFRFRKLVNYRRHQKIEEGH
jgi:tRNA G10  N-methylase Trm11